MMVKNNLLFKYSFLRLFWTEFKFNFTGGKILGLLATAVLLPGLFNFLPLIINNSEHVSEMNLIFQTINALYLSIIFRTMIVVRNRATIDKNRALFIYYNKHQVGLVKLLIDAISFLIGFIGLFYLAQILVTWRPGTFHYQWFNQSAWSAFFGYLLIYLLISLTTKWLIAFIPKRGFAYAITTLTVLVILLPLYILNQINATTTLRFATHLGADFTHPPKSWFYNHQATTTWLPLINFGLLGTGFFDFTIFNYEGHALIRPAHHSFFKADNKWYATIPMLYCLVIMGGIWTPQILAQKRYLAGG